MVPPANLHPLCNFQLARRPQSRSQQTSLWGFAEMVGLEPTVTVLETVAFAAWRHPYVQFFVVLGLCAVMFRGANAKGVTGAVRPLVTPLMRAGCEPRYIGITDWSYPFREVTGQAA